VFANPIFSISHNRRVGSSIRPIGNSLHSPLYKCAYSTYDDRITIKTPSQTIRLMKPRNISTGDFRELQPLTLVRWTLHQSLYSYASSGLRSAFCAHERREIRTRRSSTTWGTREPHASPACFGGGFFFTVP
jgi:hypothetical protein